MLALTPTDQTARPPRSAASSPWSRRVAITGAAVAALTAGLATPAFAHVSVTSDNPTRGGTAIVSFKVPTESDTASTTKLEVSVPTNPPLIGATPENHPGWKIDVKTVPLNPPVTSGDDEIDNTISLITWTAEPGQGVPPDTYELFNIGVAKLPDAPSVTFKAIQTYSDGKIVRWIATQEPGQPEADNPAPVLTLSPASGSSTTAAAATPSTTAATPSASRSSGGSDSTARALGIVGIILAVVLGAGGYLLGRRRGAGPGASSES